MSKIEISYFQEGVVVRVKKSYSGEPEGVLALVYEKYDKPGITGISLITENGRDLGGFGLDEQAEQLEFFADTGMQYIYKNQRELKKDWDSGLLPRLFVKAKKLKRDIELKKIHA